MKIWRGYGSEHSMNLVLIGHFKDVNDADDAKRLIDVLADQVQKESGEHQIGSDPRERRFSDAMSDILKKADLFTISPVELEQFCYDVRVKLDGVKIVVTTDEIDVSAFIKAFLHNGARIEVYSAHHYPDSN